MADEDETGIFDGHALDAPYAGVVLATHDPDEECEWDDQLHEDDPDCEDPEGGGDSEPDPDSECDPWAGLVEADGRDGCVVEVAAAPEWVEVGAYAGVLVLVMLAALVVAQLRR